jgi:hypothetical protein
MFRSLFRKNKEDEKPSEEDIGSATAGDVIVVAGFSETFGDAYFIVEEINRYEGIDTWYELIGADGDRKVAFEASDNSSLHIAVTEQQQPLGLVRIGVSEDELVRMDDDHSIDNGFVFNDERYSYVNSQEVRFFKGNQSDWEGLYLWEFKGENGENLLSVIKWEGLPFEVYEHKLLSSSLVSLFRK